MGPPSGCFFFYLESILAAIPSRMISDYLTYSALLASNLE